MDVSVHKTELSRNAFRYMPQAGSCVVDKVGTGKWIAQHVLGRSPQAHAALLSALFCHLRINPPDQPVEDFEGELADCLKERGIKRVLEVGPGQMPFWGYLKPLAPQLQIYGLGLGLPGWDAGITYVSGDLHRGIRNYLPQEFDLILSIGVHCVGGFVGVEDQGMRGMVAKANRSAVDLTSVLSANPYAAFFASTFFGPFSGENILMFERTCLERKTRVLFWNEPGRGRVQYLVFKMEFETEPADFVVLARRPGEPK